jgi:hypothetical protein
VPVEDCHAWADALAACSQPMSVLKLAIAMAFSSAVAAESRP